MPSMIFVGILLVILFIKGIKSGQLEDLEVEGHRILFDEDQEKIS